MPSSFLKDRFPRAVQSAAGDNTVQYLRLENSSADSLTGDIDDSLAYSSTPIELSAFVDFNPSKAIRENIGIDIQFDVLLLFAAKHVTDAGIEFKIGDAFLLPMDEKRFYAKKIVHGRQAGPDFLDIQVAVSRSVGGR